MYELLLSNVPYNCRKSEVRDWIERQGFQTFDVRLVRDLVSGASPCFGYVRLANGADAARAANILCQNTIRGQKVQVLSSNLCRNEAGA
jgi:hypothetical protein